MIRSIAAFALALCLTAPASAGFQGMEWGVKQHDGLPLTYSALGFNFKVNLEFEPPEYGLFRIQLIPLNFKECFILGEALLSIYGQSIRSQNGDGALNQWRDQANDNLVYFYSTEAACSVTYERIMQPNSNGGL